MSAVIRLGLLLLLLVGCESKDTSVVSPSRGETPYFSPEEVVGTLNALVAIIDWPQDTLSHQKNLQINLEAAQKLMLPLHPLYDDKVSEVAALIPVWDKTKVSEILSSCAKTCQCEFYQEVLDRHPQILENALPDLKKFAGQKLFKSKDSVMNCLQNMSSIQKVLDYLKAEQKHYEADSAL